MIVIERRIYQRPHCNIVCTETENLLVHASGNAGVIAPGGSYGDAKRNYFEIEESNGSSSLSGQKGEEHSMWED